MKIYIVIGYYNYYPAPDNTLGIFFSHEKALFFKEECEETGVGGYKDWYDIIEHEVIV